MPEPYPEGVTAPHHPPLSKLHAQLGARDGWRCSYCGAALAHGHVGWQAVVLGPCPGGHHDVYPCDQGCEGRTYFTLAPGYQRPEADHLVARARGGTDALDNRVLACGPCNNAKRADSLLVFLARRVAA